MKTAQKARDWSRNWFCIFALKEYDAAISDLRDKVDEMAVKDKYK